MSQDLGKVKFGNKMYFVMDKFSYNGTEYFYIVEDISEKVMSLTKNSDVDVEVNFIHKADDGKYDTVVDMNLFEELFKETTKRMGENKNSAIPENVMARVSDAIVKKLSK